MEQINAIELSDPSQCPDASLMKGILGDAYEAYEALLVWCGVMGMEYVWKYYEDGKAWLCKVQKKKKTVVWMSAWKGYMKATVYIHDKYLEELNGLGLPENVKAKFFSAREAGRSMPCMFEIRAIDALDDLKKLMTFKMSLK